MNQLFIFILGLILGVFVVWFLIWSKVVKHGIKSQPGVDKLQEFNAEREKEREVNKQKILNLLEEKIKIANDDIQKLLSVSDATATRYLDELEKDGQIKQVGQVGHYVYYEKSI